MRRFITFIDCAYEHKVKLIITAYAKHPDDLLVIADAKSFECDTRDEFFAWDRAKSRLNEMQTDEYNQLEAKNLKMAFRTIFFSSRENQRQRSARIMATLRQNQKRSLGRIRIGVFTRRFERAQSWPSKRLQRPTGPFLERTHPKAMRKSR